MTARSFFSLKIVLLGTRRLFRDHAEHFFDSGDALRGAEDAVLAHREHAFALRLLLDVVARRVLHDELFDGLRDRQHFIDTDAALIARWRFRGFFWREERDLVP